MLIYIFDCKKEEEKCGSACVYACVLSEKILMLYAHHPPFFNLFTNIDQNSAKVKNCLALFY